MRRIVALATLAVLAASPASAEVVAQSDAGFVSVNEATAAASPAALWKVLIAPATWWAPDHTYSGDAASLYLDAQATGCFCELLPLPKDAPEGTRRGSVEHAHIVYASPGKILRMSGGLGPLQSEAVGATLSIALKPEGEGTKITWTYVVGGYMRPTVETVAPMVDKMLGVQVTRLAAKAGEGARGASGSPN